jgi:hypothetical protein
MAPAQAGVFLGVSVAVAPPAIPVVVQPPIPGEGYIWTPGYWAWGPAGYYWVNGRWLLPPAIGVLWTPGYWGEVGGLWGWHAGYWGPTVGWYGGVNYGCGYFGHGFEGGYWNHNQFFYNTTYNNFGNYHPHNTYHGEGGLRHETNGGHDLGHGGGWRGGEHETGHGGPVQPAGAGFHEHHPVTQAHEPRHEPGHETGHEPAHVEPHRSEPVAVAHHAPLGEAERHPVVQPARFEAPRAAPHPAGHPAGHEAGRGGRR